MEFETMNFSLISCCMYLRIVACQSETIDTNGTQSNLRWCDRIFMLIKFKKRKRKKNIKDLKKIFLSINYLKKKKY